MIDRDGRWPALSVERAAIARRAQHAHEDNRRAAAAALRELLEE